MNAAKNAPKDANSASVLNEVEKPSVVALSWRLCDAQGEIPGDRAEMTRILREERLYVGEGGVPVADILNRLPKMVYSIELPHMARVREFGYAEHAFRCLESAKDYMGRACVHR